MRSLTRRCFDKLTIPYGCWDWTGTKTDDGYGRVHTDAGMRVAHRVIYELLVGEIPEGHDLDHLCRNRACCNPQHLEPVTRRENLLRGDTIPAAHVAGRDCGHDACVSCPRPAAALRGGDAA